jgi:hypothetical protein
MKGDTVTVIALFSLIIGITLWISYASSIKSYSPYSPSNKYAAYEGYQNIEYSKVNTQTSLDDAAASQNPGSHCIQLSGWKGYGVFCTPNGGLDKIDIYSQAKGDISCENKSSGYHNSKGGLCLDQNMFDLLQTRGMNATGGYGQIGSGTA